MLLKRKSVLKLPTRAFQHLLEPSTLPPAATASPSLKPYTAIPGPKSIPFLGNFLNCHVPGTPRDPQNALVTAGHLHRLHGDMVRMEIPFQAKMVMVSHPELVEKVYRASATQPIRPGFFSFGYWQKNYKAAGLLTTQKEEWQTFRSKVQQPMLRPRSTHGFTRAIEEVATDFIEDRILRLRADNDEMPDDFLAELHKWALESVSSLALNARLGCLDPNLAKDSEPDRYVNAVMTTFELAAQLDNTIHFWKVLPSKKLDKLIASCNLFKSIALRHIHAALRDIRQRREAGVVNEEPTLLEMLEAHGCDEATIVTMALEMMFGGVDTTSHALAFAMYHLARNPKVQEQLYVEVASQLPTKESKLDKKALDQMPYLKAVVKESLRQSPSIAMNTRTLIDDLELNGYLVPAGTTVILDHYHMMNSSRFVREPTQFVPERWIKGHPRCETMHPFLSLPFGYGSRMCVGRRFAEQEMYVFLAKMLQRFRVEWRYGDLGMKIKTITFPDKPLKFAFIDR